MTTVTDIKYIVCEYRDDTVDHLLGPDGTGMCHSARPDLNTVHTYDEYRADQGYNNFTLDSLPENVCQRCAKAVRDLTPAPALPEQTGTYNEDTAFTAQATDQEFPVTKWRFKWAQDARNVKCDVYTHYDAPLTELKEAICSGLGLSVGSHAWEFTESKRHDTATYEFMQPRLADSTFGVVARREELDTTFDASETTVRDVIEEMQLNVSDRLQFIYDFGTQDRAYGILKDLRVTDFPDCADIGEEESVDVLGAGVAIPEASEERASRY